jgi:hypothetical protein
VDIMNWFDSLPAADAQVPCGSGRHTVRWEAGKLTLPSHPDAEAELVLGALGGDKPECVTVAEVWARHAADLAVLGVGPRCAADQVTVSWDEVAEQRGSLSGVTPAVPMPPGSGTSGPGTSGPGTSGPGTSGPGTQRPRRVVTARSFGGVAPAGSGTPVRGFGGPGAALARGMGEGIHRAQQRIELFQLLALGPALQFRLSGTVCAAWAEPDRANERAALRPQFAAALSGRFAPAAEEWLGIDPDAVTVTPHEGPGWGTMRVSGTGEDRGLRASLPLGWLASVWACGLAVVDGHLVVAVEEPGFPQARVLALPAPGGTPIALTVRATPDATAAARPAWVLAPHP